MVPRDYPEVITWLRAFREHGEKELLVISRDHFSCNWPAASGAGAAAFPRKAVRKILQPVSWPSSYSDPPSR